MNIALNTFRDMIGTYSKGYVEFARNDQGEVTGLKKVANRRTFTLLNESEASVARRLGGANAYEMRHAFVESLRNELGADLPHDLVRSILVDDGNPNAKPLSRREIRQVFEKVDLLKERLLDGADGTIRALARDMGVPETGADGKLSPEVAFAREGYVAMHSVIADFFKPGFPMTEEGAEEAMLLAAKNFRDVGDRHPSLDVLGQATVLRLAMHALLESCEAFRTWVEGDPQRARALIGRITDLMDEISDFPGADGTIKTQEGLENRKRVIVAGVARDALMMAIEQTEFFSGMHARAQAIAAEFEQALGATAEDVERLMKRMTLSAELICVVKHPDQVAGQVRSLMSGLAEIRRRLVAKGHPEYTFERLLDMYAGTTDKLRSLDFRLQDEKWNAANRGAKKYLVDSFKYNLGKNYFANWAKIHATTVREYYPGMVTINGEAVPAAPGPAFTMADGTVVDEAKLGSISTGNKTQEAKAFVQKLVQAISDERMRAFVTQVLSMSDGVRGFFAEAFHQNGNKSLTGMESSNYMRMSETGVFVTQIGMTPENTHNSVTVEEDGTVKVKIRFTEGFGVSHVDGHSLALQGEDAVKLRVPLISQGYEATITVQPGSFDENLVPDFTVETKAVD